MLIGLVSEPGTRKSEKQKKKKKRFKNVCDKRTSLLVANRSRRKSRREGSGYKRGGLVFFQGAHRYNP